MMAIDLRGARSKIARAREHAGALAEAIDRFLASEPFAIGRRLEDGGLVHEYFFAKYTEPPATIGLLVGDAIHNIRSALDHVAFEMARAGAAAVGEAMTPTEEANIHYPICVTPAKFTQQIQRNRLLFVEPCFVSFIERYQPYQFQLEYPERAVPSVIATLDNHDKHRAIPMLSSVISWNAYSLPPDVQEPKRTLVRSERWGTGAVVVRYAFDQPRPGLDLDFAPVFTLAIDKGWPPTFTAVDVVNLCAGFVETFILNQLETWVGAV